MARAKFIVLISLALALIAIPHKGGADWVFKIEHKSQAIPWLTDGTVLIEQYLSGDAGLTIMPDRIVIMHFKDQIMHELDKATKTYTTSKANSGDSSSDTASASGSAQDGNPLLAAIKSFTGAGQVTLLAESRRVVGYNCRGYDADHLAALSRIWATRDIPNYKELVAASEKALRMLSRHPLMRYFDIPGLFREIDGFPVYTTTWLLDGTMTNMVFGLEQKPIASEFFKIPAGYKPAQARQP